MRNVNKGDLVNVRLTGLGVGVGFGFEHLVLANKVVGHRDAVGAYLWIVGRGVVGRKESVDGDDEKKDDGHDCVKKETNSQCR